MSLEAGTLIGPYEILALVGSGGMGEVYKARDSRLDRFVAIKTLHNPSALERFQREARAISSLNHPHICALYDIGPDYLVMEFVEGKALAGPMPAAQALRLAIQIADALDHAHSNKVVHRDLKPGNIFVTKSGVKLLDFGLAKLLTPAKPATDSTVTAALTERNTILGTLLYMSPEQVEGGEITARSDVFSFGLVLYELLTGNRAFKGNNQASVIGEILHKQPPSVSSLQPLTPVELDRVVESCLAKDPADRFQSARDLRRALEWCALPHSKQEPAIPPPPAPRPIHGTALIWAAAASMVLAVILVFIFVLRPVPQTPPEVAFQFLPPTGTRMTGGTLSISPNGKMIAFSAATGGTALLWIRSLDSIEPRRVQGTENAYFGCFSPDNRHLAFFADGKLKKVPVEGGAAIELAEAPLGRGVTWGRSGSLVYAPGTATGLYRVDAAGGPAEPVTKLDDGRAENSHRWPWFLPDGKHVLFMVRAGKADESRVDVLSLDSGQRKSILRRQTNPGFSNGHLFYTVERNLFAQPFDPATFALSGEPFVVAGNIRPIGPITPGAYSVSENGTLVHTTGDMERRKILAVNRNGDPLRELYTGDPIFTLVLSPDQSRLAFDPLDNKVGTRDIWVLDLRRPIPLRITSDVGDDRGPIWGADSRTLFFSQARNNVYSLARTEITGMIDNQQSQEFLGAAYDVSPDGKWALGGLPGLAAGDVYKASLNPPGKPQPYLTSQFREIHPRFSLNGKWVLYSSNETGRLEVFATAFPEPTVKIPISTGGGFFPSWRGDGKEIFYQSIDGWMTSARVLRDDPMETSPPERLFRFAARDSFLVGHQYASTRDGKAFYIVVAVNESVEPVTVTTNWLPARR